MSYGTINADTLQNSGGFTASASSIPFRNRIINGAMAIAQRGTSSTSAGYQTLDRWYGNASNSTTFAQTSSFLPTGFMNAFQLTAGATAQMWIQQPVETKNCFDLAGQNVTLSCQLAASTATNVTLYLYYSTSVDNPASGSWTAIGSSAVSVGTSYASYSATFAVPSTAKTIMPQIITTSTVASGTSIYITGVQLEKGSVASSFEYRPYGTEIALCQRYTRTYGDGLSGIANASNTWYSNIAFENPMRAAPSGSLLSTAIKISDQYSLDATSSGSTITSSNLSSCGGRIDIGGWSGLTQGRFYSPYGNGLFLLLSAEL